MAKYRDIKFNLGSTLDTMGNTGTVTGATFSQKEKGQAIEFGQGKYVTYDSQLLPTSGAYSVVVWAKSVGKGAPAIASVVNGGAVSIHPYGTSGALLFLGSANYRYFTFNNDNKWHCFVFTVPGTAQADISSSQCFIDGISASTVSTDATGAQSARTGCIYTGGGSASTSKAFISRIKVYDTVLSQTEVNAEYVEFLNAMPVNKPKRGFILPNKPTDLSPLVGSGAGQGLLAAYNMKKVGISLTDISGNGKNGTIGNYIVSTVKGLAGIGGNSTANAVALSSTIAAFGTGDYSVSFRAKFIATGNDNGVFGSVDSLVVYRSNASGSIVVGKNATTDVATGITIPVDTWATVTLTRTGSTGTSYLNGVLVTTYTENSNHNVAISYLLSRGFGTSAFGGEIQDLRFHNRVLSATEIAQYHNQFVQPTLIEDFSDAGADGITKTDAPSREWERVTGTWKVGEVTTPDAVLPTITKGTKYIENVTAGIISIPSNNAYGSWEFDWYKASTSNSIVTGFISTTRIPTTTGTQGYVTEIGSDEALYLYAFTGSGFTSLMSTAISYIANNTWYRMRITRTTAGVFTVLIKGGAFTPTAGYDGWTLVSVSGGAGTNPVTNTTYTSSGYFTVDMDAGDRITDIFIRDGIKV